MSDQKVHLNHERRLTRLEYLMYLVALLSGLNLVGIRVFDSISLLPHP